MSQPATIQPIKAQTPRLRRLPAVDPEPPFDDERVERQHRREGLESASAVSRAGAGRQSVLALAFALPGGLPDVPDVPPALRTAPITEPVAESADEPRLRLVETVAPPARSRRSRRHRPSVATIEDEFGPQRTPRDQLPEPQLWSARLVQAFVEVHAGLRPAAQLIRWTTTAVQDTISRQPSLSATASATDVRTRRHGEVVRSVRASEPVDGVVEVSAVVQRGDRCRAIALRLEGIDGRWQCTAVQLG
jgi:hypothetical protein